MDLHQNGLLSSMLQVEIGVNAYLNSITSWGQFDIRYKLSYINRQSFGLGNINADIVGAPGAYVGAPGGFVVTTFTQNQSIVSPSVELTWRTKQGSYASLLYDGEFGSGWKMNEFVARLGRFSRGFRNGSCKLRYILPKPTASRLINPLDS